MKEAELRDLIARDIGRLKPGLTLLQREQYIPGEQGTRSFIDLYAKDERNRHVLIELKRSDVSARQAIHEVHKYVERVKGYFGARDREIHVIIASTKWDELLLPFSRLCGDAGFSVEGIQITVTEGGGFEARPVTPLPVVQGRFLAPWHNVFWYTDSASFRRGIASIEESYRQKGIDDYVIVSFHRPDPSTPEERRAALRANVAKLVGAAESELSGLPSSIPSHEYIAYTAVQMLSMEKCMEILSRDSHQLEEARELLPSMEEEEALRYLHESVECVKPVPKHDFYEIGYPAKFSKFYEMEDCRRLGILRHGIFQRNAVLTDEALYGELQGEDGSTGQKFKRTVAVRDAAYVRDLKEDLDAALRENPVWRHNISRIIGEIEAEFPDAEMEISVFNPCTGIFTIYYALTREQGFLYLPTYHILVKNPEVTRMYFGSLAADGPAMTLRQLLNQYYEGKLEALLMAVTWGGRDERDSDIIEGLGAQYRSYRVDLADGGPRKCFVLRDEKWRPCETLSIIDLFRDYVEKNRELVNQIILQIGAYDRGAIFDFTRGEAGLEKYVDMTAAEKRRRYYAGAPDTCDLCGRPLSKERFMVDGKVRGEGFGWANMCAGCFLSQGVGIGWGVGQLYQKDENGWLEVGGFCPEEEEP